MTRLLIHVEGETEETFVNEVLRPHLFGYGYSQVSARLIGNARLRSRRGGIQGWHVVRNDILRHLKTDVRCLSTTMVDYYGLPHAGQANWPGRATASGVPFINKAPTVENAIRADICRELGSNCENCRFIPFVVMHEFEGLLFSDCKRFSIAVGRPDVEAALQAVRNAFGCPEEINDSPTNAPSKRVQAILAGYEKPLMGTLAVLEMGLEVIRTQCPHFAQWMAELEARAA